MSRIVALGGAHIDRRGRISGATVPAASNPGTWKEEPGGGTFNCARALARLGHQVVLVSPRGGDAEGEAVARAADAAGIIDRPVTFLDRRTPSYTAIMEHDGNLVIAIADMDLYRMFAPRRLAVRQLRDEMDQAEFMLTDANFAPETLAAIAEAAERRGLPLAGIGISPAKVVRYRALLDRFSYLFMNEAEARALTDKSPEDFRQWPAIMRAAGLEGGAITRGSRELIAWAEGSVAVLTPPPVEKIGDVTGAGDGFAAGFLHARIESGGLAQAIRHGAASARLALESEMATAEDLTRAMLADMLGLVPAAEIML